MGSKKGFLTTRLKNYSTDRNNPLKPQALSGLSPYLHFGQISAQRCALEAHKVRKNYTQVVDSYLFIYVSAIILLNMKHFLQSIEIDDKLALRSLTNIFELLVSVYLI